MAIETNSLMVHTEMNQFLNSAATTTPKARRASQSFQRITKSKHRNLTTIRPDRLNPHATDPPKGPTDIDLQIITKTIPKNCFYDSFLLFDQKSFQHTHDQSKNIIFPLLPPSFNRTKHSCKHRIEHDETSQDIKRSQMEHIDQTRTQRSRTQIKDRPEGIRMQIDIEQNALQHKQTSNRTQHHASEITIILPRNVYNKTVYISSRQWSSLHISGAQYLELFV